MDDLTIFEIRVRASLGYFSYYKVPANDVGSAKDKAVKMFKNDFGCTNEYPETYCFNPHQQYEDAHKGEPIVCE